MSGDLAVVWLAEGAPSKAAEEALAAWARAHGVTLVAPRPDADGKPVDLGVGLRVEQELERAREAIAATDAEAVDQALARAEGLVRDHPELPEAAWLRAEVLRSWSARWLRLAPRDEARARAAWEEAQALDGGRVAGIGEVPSAARAKAHAGFVLRGVRSPRRVVVRVDGAEVPLASASPAGLVYEIDLAPTEHQLVVTVDGRVVHAAWTATRDAPVPIELAGEDPCSSGALAGVRREDGQLAASTVACPAWVAVAPGPDAGLLVARCTEGTCAPLVEWHVEHAATRPAPARPPERKRWPTWATVALVGVGAAGAAVLGVVASGALKSDRTETRFTVGGVRTE